ncbi:MAG: carbohydrate kinase family protein [Pirellulales bacterium]
MAAWDCVVCGETCLDLVAGPLPLHQPLAHRGLVPLASLEAVAGGIVPNAGIALARLGLRVAALGLVGRDPWGELIRRRLIAERLDVRDLIEVDDPSSTTLVMVGADREHTFAFRAGASQRIDRRFLLDRLDRFAAARYALVGYYNLLPNLEADLPEVMRAIRETGCRTALDATNGGGSLAGLDRILPHLDLYVPSYSEAQQQTGETDPRRMLDVYRRYAPQAILGIKLGEAGALLWGPGESPVSIAAVAPPGPVVDTTGAGDSFYAGLIAALARDLPLAAAGRIAAAAGACSVTALGASAAIRDWDATVALARIAEHGT